jgi:hypothetical protein
MTPRDFERLARSVMAQHYGTAFPPVAATGDVNAFALVSADGTIMGDARYLSLVQGHRMPAAKFAMIAQQVWLLEKTNAIHKFLVFGSQIEVPHIWLKKYGSLVVGVEFFFLYDDGALIPLDTRQDDWQPVLPEQQAAPGRKLRPTRSRRSGDAGNRPSQSRVRPLILKRRSRVRVPRRVLYPTLYIETILEWADAYYQRTGQWPTDNSGSIPESSGDTWSKVNAALSGGLRDLPGGSSLARLLAEYRGVRNRKALPHFSEEQILAWADSYHQRTGKWPKIDSGTIPEAPGETWTAVAIALSHGRRGLPGGSSLAILLDKHRGVRNPRTSPRLNEAQILAWADAHYAATGKWPIEEPTPITAAPNETWERVSRALRKGVRGLPGGSSLARLLAEKRGVINRAELPPLSVAQILAWADAHYQRTGRWPIKKSGAVEGEPNESWSAIDTVLHQGNRGLPGAPRWHDCFMNNEELLTIWLCAGSRQIRLSPGPSPIGSDISVGLMCLPAL